MIKITRQKKYLMRLIQINNIEQTNREMEYSVWRPGEPAERSYPKKEVVKPTELALEEGSDSNQRIQESVASKVDFDLEFAEMRQGSCRRNELNDKTSDRQLVPSQGTQNPFFVGTNFGDVLNVQEQWLRPKSSHFENYDNKHLNTEQSS